MNLPRAYQTCQHITRRNAKNFYYASLTLPKSKRQSIYSVYAFCRLCDDAVDEPASLREKLSQLETIRDDLNSALRGVPQGPIFTALSDTIQRYSIPHDYITKVINGVEVDLTQKRFKDFESLKQYCFGVASVVGLICARIFGYTDPLAEKYAIDLGLAMQLTNILRDIKEDFEQRDRVYIPLDEMERFGYSEQDLKNRVTNPAFYGLISFQIERARKYFDVGFQLLPLIPVRSRACPAILGAIYKRILDKIETRRFNLFEGRLRLSTREKMFIVTVTWIRSLFPRRL